MLYSYYFKTISYKRARKINEIPKLDFYSIFNAMYMLFYINIFIFSFFSSSSPILPSSSFFSSTTALRDLPLRPTDSTHARVVPDSTG